jgi:LysM repeat protein
MSSEKIIPRTVTRGLLVVIATALGACTSPQQKMTITPESIATPPHRMPRAEYPFDAAGRYVDAWAAEGAVRYGRRVNTDRSEDGRIEPTAPPERRPLVIPVAHSSQPTPTAANRTAANRTAASQPAASPTKKSTASSPPPPRKTTAKTTAKSTAKTAAKPRTTSHIVKRGDSLSSLSKRYGVSVQALKKANSLKSNMIRDGRKLVIPRK